MKPKILVCVLCGGERHYWIHPSLALMLIAMAKDSRFEVLIQTVTDKRPVDFARNFCVSLAEAKRATWLLMIDNDESVRSNPLDVLLLAGDKKIIGIPAAQLSVGPTISGPVITTSTEGPISQDEHFVEVKAVGSGVLFVHHEVWERMGQPLFFTTYKNLREVDTGEDFNFCHSARDAGFNVFATKFVANHFHTAETASQASLLYQAIEAQVSHRA